MLITFYSLPLSCDEDFREWGNKINKAGGGRGGGVTIPKVSDLIQNQQFSASYGR